MKLSCCAARFLSGSPGFEAYGWDPELRSNQDGPTSIVRNARFLIGGVSQGRPRSDVGRLTLYAAFGYSIVEPYEIPMSGGVGLPVVLMSKSLRIANHFCISAV
jgi:hypothetical protein